MGILVFSDNVFSTKIKIDHLFKKTDNKFIFFRIYNIPFSGYKYNLKNEEKSIRMDFTLYKKKCQPILLYHRNIEKNLPFYISILLIILKYLHYYLYIINNRNYSYLKKKYGTYLIQIKQIPLLYKIMKYIKNIMKMKI